MNNKKTIKDLLWLVNLMFIFPFITIISLLIFVFGGVGSDYLIYGIIPLVYIIISIIMGIKSIIEIANNKNL